MGLIGVTLDLFYVIQYMAKHMKTKDPGYPIVRVSLVLHNS